ncbi:MAG: serine hydrolase [Chitinophagaceae bacterium]
MKFITILCLSFLLSFTCFSQDFSNVTEWLQNNTGEMGGRSVLVIFKNDKIIYDQAINMMTPAQQSAFSTMSGSQKNKVDLGDFTADKKMPIASCSKWLSAALVMTFIDEGKLNLEDTVGKFLPILSANGKGNITITECLSHTTGIKAPELKEGITEIVTSENMAQAIQRIAALPMESAPGKSFHYSNVGLQIAAAVIEKISGKDFKTLFAERIAKPLDMQQTDFGQGKVPLPAGGANSTANDYLHFLEMILNNGTYQGKIILSVASIKAMQVNRITPDVKVIHSPDESKIAGYGFGEWLMKVDSVNNFYSSPGLFGSFPWVDYTHHYCAFLMTYNLNNKGRQDLYASLISIVDKVVH